MTVEAVMNWALQTGLMVSLLIIAILLIRRPFARIFGASATYALWSLPLVRLFLPAIAIPQNWFPKWIQSETVIDNVNPISEFPVVRPIVAEAPVPIEGVSQSASSLTGFSILIGIWIGVAVTWFAYQLLQQRAFMRRLKRTSLKADANLLSEAQNAANVTGLRTLPELRRAPDNSGPFVTGVLRPLVILPANFRQNYTAEQRQYAFIHEFAHIKRRDLWAAFAALMFRAINWFNPLVHYAARKMRTDQEAACDAFVLTCTHQTQGNRADYAKTLLQAAKSAVPSKAATGLALSLSAHEDNNIEEKETSK